MICLVYDALENLRCFSSSSPSRFQCSKEIQQLCAKLEICNRNGKARTKTAGCKCCRHAEQRVTADLSKLSNIARLKDLPSLLWLFTESNFPTFVVPNTAFGILGAISGLCLTTQKSPSGHELLQRLPLVVLFNWSNVLIFDFANQRLPESVEEDLANKPWRPLPTGKVTAEQTRRLMLIAIPAVLALNFAFGVWRETALILILTWLYNDLKGGDEIIRDLIIAVAFGLYNMGSLRIAISAETEITAQGYTWIVMISGAILTTMQVQDLKDQAGDRGRGRLTIPLLLGEGFSRWSIAMFVLIWSGCCGFFWELQPWMYALPAISAGFVAFHVVYGRTPEEDCRTWKLWCLWTIILYALPIVHRSQAMLESSR